MKADKRCEQTLEKLYKFSSELLQLGEGNVSNLKLETFEKKIGFKLADDFKYILKKHNGINLAETEVYSLSDEAEGNSLDSIFEFEHYEVENPMPINFLPFSPDGRGNHYCLDLARSSDGICPVVFWQYDFGYDSINAIEVCNDSFTDWIDEVMIGWTLENYHYDGTEK